MDNQISLFPDILGTEIEKIVMTECERTKKIEHDNYVAPIKSLHEGYGYAAERYASLSTNHKRLKENLTTYLNRLSADSELLDVTIEEIYNHSQEAAKDAVLLSAIARRILDEVRGISGLPEEAYGEANAEAIEYEDTDNEEE